MPERIRPTNARDRADLRPPDRRSVWRWIFLILMLLIAAVIGAFGWQWWQQQHGARSAVSRIGSMFGPAPNDGQPPPSAEASAPLTSPPPVADTGPKFPIETPEPAADASATPLISLTPAQADKRVEADVDKVIGSQTVASFLQMDGFVRRMVATVDNLARDAAPVGRWPVQPTGPRLLVDGDGETATLSLDNGGRYTPFVTLAEQADPAEVAALYRKLYPLFQKAYEELGYPDKYFNDRLIAVIDSLLAAPEPTEPVRLTLMKIKGPYADAAPWTRWEFVDPQLKALTSGQKIMVRLGIANELRMKARLRALRKELVAGGKPAR